MSDPLAGLLEGLGTGFEHGQDRRRKNRLSDELMTLRQLEEQRLGRQADTEEARTNLAVSQAQAAQRERDRVTKLRTEVGNYLAAPTHFKTLGNYLENRDGQRQAPPLSQDAVTAQAVGHALSRLSGRDVSDEDALVMGAGMIPASTINAMRPRAAARAGGRGGRLTEQQAFQQIDNTYGIWRAGERVGHRLSPAQRAGLAQKMVNGTATAADFPDIPGEDRGTPAAPGQQPKPAQSGTSIFQKIKAFFGGGSGSSAPVEQSDQRGGAVAPPDDHFKEARAILHDPRYADLDDDEMRSALQDAGYDDDEIDQILAGGAEGP